MLCPPIPVSKTSLKAWFIDTNIKDNYFILLSFLPWIKRNNAIEESWAHLLTEHLDTEETLPIEIDRFVVYATTHRWRSQLFKNKATQTCLKLKQSSWLLQFVAPQYINSTQSPSITKATVSNLFSHIFTANSYVLHNKILQRSFLYDLN